MNYIFTEEIFADESNWFGGYYELAIEISPASSIVLSQALQILWQHEMLVGCYESRSVIPSRQLRVTPTLETMEVTGHLYGLISLPNKAIVPCGCFIVREEDGSDWLNLYIPTGVLIKAYNTHGFPFGAKNSSLHKYKDWRKELDDCLLTLCRYIHSQVPFDLALIGMEVSGTTYAQEVAVNGIPAQRWLGYVWQIDKELVWYPPTEENA